MIWELLSSTSFRLRVRRASYRPYIRVRCIMEKSVTYYRLAPLRHSGLFCKTAAAVRVTMSAYAVFNAIGQLPSRYVLKMRSQTLCFLYLNNFSDRRQSSY